ncbi:MAG: dethiobiotin synthase [Acidobacteria bacterium]|jgi:dethiobiotin synthetase|nr:MAG: dethiobiotin synthase [Acidobacteriota bacterium]
MASLFITGTDTGVGKTFISYNLVYALMEKGVKVGYLKPVETGVESVPADGSLLSSLTGQSIDEVVPVRYRLPLAPYAGILEEGKDFSLERLREHYYRLINKYEFLVVEGAGGVAVPIKRSYNYADLAKDWGLRVLIVARAGLGTINHTFLTWHYLTSRGIEVVGIVMSGFEGKDPSERTNHTIVRELTGLEVLCIPKVDGMLIPKELRSSLAELVLL